MKPRKKYKSPFSIEGYKFNSPDRFKPFNIIDSGRITMKDVNMPLFAVDNEGNQGIMMPGEEYQFPGDRVLEVPLNLVPPQQKPYNYFVVNTPQNYVGGANFRLPQNIEIGTVGVLPKNPNPYFKGVADIGVRRNFNDYSVGANVGIPFAKNPNTGERTITPQLSFKYNFDGGGSLPKAQPGGGQPSRTITVDTSTLEGLKRMQAYQDSATMYDRSIVADALFNDLLKKHGVDPEKQFESYEHLPDNEFHNFSEGDTWFQTFDLERGKKRALSQEEASAFAKEVQNKIKFNKGPFPYGFEGGLHDLERWGLWDLMDWESIAHRPIQDPNDDEGYYITQDFFWRPKLQPPPNVRVVEGSRPEESLVNLPIKGFSEDKPPREVLSRLNPGITNMKSYGSGQGVILEMSDGRTLRMPKQQFAQFRKMGDNEEMIQNYRLSRKNGGSLPKAQIAGELKSQDLVPRDPFSALSPAQREAFNASTVAAMKAKQERQLEEYMRRSPGGDLFPDQGLKPVDPIAEFLLGRGLIGAGKNLFNLGKGAFTPSQRNLEKYGKALTPFVMEGGLLYEDYEDLNRRYGGSLPEAQKGKEVPYGSPEYRKAYREGRVQGQILPEIDVVAERPDYAADVQRAFGAFVTAPFAGAFNAMTVPQALAVEQMERMRGRPYNYANAFDINPLDNPVSKGVFGTDQRFPSEALEIENPVGAFALDAFTDPLGLIGGKSLVQTGARRLGNALKSGTKAGVKDLADPTNVRALTDAQASQIKSRLVKKPGILDQIVQRANQTKRAIKDHKVGLKRGVRELKDPDGRSFFEVFPITKKQRLNIIAKQDAAAKEADDFARLYVTEDGKRLTAPMRNVLNAWGSPGARRGYDIYSGEQDLFKNHTPILTETRSRRLNPDLSPRQVKYIKNNRSSFGGVDIQGNRPMTVRNYGFYFRPPEALAGTVAHEFAHKVPQQLWIPNPYSIGTTKLSRRMSPWAYADEAGEGYKYHVHPRYHSNFDAISQEGPFAVSEAEKALGMSSTQYPGFDYDLGAFYGLKNHKVSQRAFDNLKVPTKVSKGKDSTYQTWLASPLEVGAEKMKARYFSFKNLQKQNPNLTPKEFLRLDEIADRFQYLEDAPQSLTPHLFNMAKMQGADWDIIKQIQNRNVEALKKHFKGYDRYGRPIEGKEQISPEEIHKTIVNFQTGGSTYKIKPGDTLSQIANRFGTSVQELVDLNKINDPNLIIANQTLNLPSAQAVAPQPSTVQPAAQASSIQPSAAPAQNQNVYTVRSGDTLGQIAKAHKTTVKRLAKINNIDDPDKIFPNQEIVLPQNFVPIKPVQKEAWHDIDELNNSNQKINQLSDEEIVLKAQTLADPNERFVVVDKKEKMFRYYQGDHVLMEFEIITGKNEGDAQTVTKAIDINNDGIITDADRVNGEFEVDWSMGNLNTGAGKYTIDQSMATTDYDGYYQYAPSFTLLNERGTPVGTAIHGTPKYREKFFGNNILDDNRQSSGCINGKCTDIQALYDMGLAKGTSVYILPEDAGNRFEFVDGQAVLRMSKENREKYAGAYTDQKGREQTGQGGNYSVNTLKYKPIRPKFDEKTFREKVFQSSDNNDEQELAETTMPFINALVENKQAIMKEARIPGDVYNQIARMAFGIYGTESNFGDTHSGAGNFIRAVNKFTNRQNASSPDVVSKYYTYNQKADNNSVGYTQIRWSFLNDDEKKALSNLGITSNEDFLDPTKSAIATAAILGIRYNQQLKPSQKKDMWKHLPGKWNNRKNYSDRVFQNSRYLTFQQLDKLQTGGEINHLDMYSGYVQGKYDGTEDEKSAKDIYDKLNRVYYNEAKLAGTSVPNYIMSYMMDGRA